MATIGRPVQNESYRNIEMKGSVPEFSNVQYKDMRDHVNMGKDGFLQLLTTQLTNQDPSNPTDSDKLGAELAQFSQLEQLNNIKEAISNGQSKSDLNNDRFYSASLIGKKVSTNSTSFQFRGKPVEIPISLPEFANNLFLRIYDLKGQLINQKELQRMDAGDHKFTWDGIGFDERMVTEGEYIFEVIAWNETGSQMELTTKSTGEVTGVEFSGSDIILEIDGAKKVFLKDIEGLSN